MNSREFTSFAERDPAVKPLLEQLIQPVEVVPSEPYQAAMRELGRCLSRSLLEQHAAALQEKDICLISTVEDADFLAAGILDGLVESGLPESRLFFQCYWNERVREGGVSITPVIRQYVEPFEQHKAAYIVVKSIISSGCVIRTNLTRALTGAEADSVYILSPVMVEGAQVRLTQEFPPELAARFSYIWFATDAATEGDIVTPGVGGLVYDRLGFDGEVGKNTHTPRIVKQRRRTHFSCAA